VVWKLQILLSDLNWVDFGTTRKGRISSEAISIKHTIERIEDEDIEAVQKNDLRDLAQSPSYFI